MSLGTFCGQVGFPEGESYPTEGLDDKRRDDCCTFPCKLRAALLQSKIQRENSHEEECEAQPIDRGQCPQINLQRNDVFGERPEGYDDEDNSNGYTSESKKQ